MLSIEATEDDNRDRDHLFDGGVKDVDGELGPTLECLGAILILTLVSVTLVIKRSAKFI